MKRAAVVAGVLAQGLFVGGARMVVCQPGRHQIAGTHETRVPSKQRAPCARGGQLAPEAEGEAGGKESRETGENLTQSRIEVGRMADSEDASRGP